MASGGGNDLPVRTLPAGPGGAITAAGRPASCSLTPKAFDLLVYLVEHQGRLVEKSTLMSALWPDTIVEEANLAFQISALRKALDDGGNGETLIQTVPTRGYRFVGVVSERVSSCSRPAGTVAPSTNRRAHSPGGCRRTFASHRRPFPGRVKSNDPAGKRTCRSTDHRDRRRVPPGVLPGRHPGRVLPAAKGCPSRWCGPQSEHSGLWQMVVGSTDVRQLTTGAGFDVNARFSPDGRQVAFVRRQDALGRRRIMLVSAVGGPAAKLSDFPAADAADRLVG